MSKDQYLTKSNRFLLEYPGTSVA